MRLTVIVPDKTIIKNGIAVHVDDNSFWTDYTESVSYTHLRAHET